MVRIVSTPNGSNNNGFSGNTFCEDLLFQLSSANQRGHDSMVETRSNVVVNRGGLSFFQI